MVIRISCPKYVGFGDNIIQWINNFKYKLLCCNFTVRILIITFFLYKGCRQEDQVAPYLFIMCEETLVIIIKQNTDNKGIYINDIEQTLSQCADDT